MISEGSRRKHEIHRHHQADAGGEVVPVKCLSFEDQGRKKNKYHEGDDLLDDFQLHEGERSAVLLEADAVGGHLGAIFKKSDAPREKDDADERPVGGHLHFLELEVAVPGKSHEYIGKQQQRKGLEYFHNEQSTDNFLQNYHKWMKLAILSLPLL